MSIHSLLSPHILPAYGDLKPPPAPLPALSPIGHTSDDVRWALFTMTMLTPSPQISADLHGDMITASTSNYAPNQIALIIVEQRCIGSCLCFYSISMVKTRSRPLPCDINSPRAIRLTIDTIPLFIILLGIHPALVLEAAGPE